jgi:O-antigen ligase
VIGILDFRHRRVASVGFGNPNLLAGYMVIALPVITGLLLANVNKVSIFAFHHKYAYFLKLFLYIISIITILFVLYLCKSRGAWLALAGGTVSFLILLVLNNKKRLTMLILSIAVIGTIIFSLFLVPIAEELILDVRPFIWLGTLKMIKAHPIIGSGIGTYLINYPNYRSKEYFLFSHTIGEERGWLAQDVTDHAHSEYLEIAAETGLVGLTLYPDRVNLWGGERFNRQYSEYQHAICFLKPLLLV